MATAVWTGSLSLGLVVVPVRLFPAIHKKTVRFHELDRAGRRVRHVRVAGPDLAPEPYGRDAVDLQRAPRFDTAAPPTRFFEAPPTAPEVAYQEVRKGYEVAPGISISRARRVWQFRHTPPDLLPAQAPQPVTQGCSRWWHAKHRTCRFSSRSSPPRSTGMR